MGCAGFARAGASHRFEEEEEEAVMGGGRERRRRAVGRGAARISEEEGRFNMRCDAGACVCVLSRVLVEALTALNFQ